MPEQNQPERQGANQTIPPFSRNVGVSFERRTFRELQLASQAFDGHFKHYALSIFPEPEVLETTFCEGAK
jgi:hypothetical protein